MKQTCLGERVGAKIKKKIMQGLKTLTGYIALANPNHFQKFQFNNVTLEHNHGFMKQLFTFNQGLEPSS